MAMLTGSGATQSRTTWIDAVRGVAIALVVVGHVIQFGAHGSFDIFTNPVFVTIYSFHMPLFAIVSGYLALSSVRKYQTRDLISQRAKGLLVPFAAWTIFGGAVLAFLRQASSGSFAAAALLESMTRGFLFPESSLWFLWIMFCCYVLAAAAIRISGRYWIVGGVALGVAIFMIPADAVLAVTQLKWLYPFFLLGMIFREYGGAYRKWERVCTGVCLVCFVVLLQFWKPDDSVYVSRMSFQGSSILQIVEDYGYRYSVALMGSVATIGIVRCIARRFPVAKLALLGGASLGIYAVQTYPVTALNLIPSPSSHSGIYFFVYVPLVSLAILLVSYVVSEFALRRYRLTRIVFLGAR